MSRGAAWVLRASSLWSLWVWGVLVRNMVLDRAHSRSFRAVHLGLAAVSLAFAGTTWVIAGRARRGQSEGGAAPGNLPGPKGGTATHPGSARV